MLLQRHLAVALTALALTACGSRDGSAVDGRQSEQEPEIANNLPAVGTLPQGAEKAAGEQGRELFQLNCVMCHGERAEGTQLGPSLVDAAWLAGRTGTFDEIAAVVRDGVAAPDSFPVPMPARGNGAMTDAEVRSVAAYTYSIQSAARPTP